MAADDFRRLLADRSELLAPRAGLPPRPPKRARARDEGEDGEVARAGLHGALGPAHARLVSTAATDGGALAAAAARAVLAAAPPGWARAGLAAAALGGGAVPAWAPALSHLFSAALGKPTTTSCIM